MSAASWVRTPIGPEARRWNTVAFRRTVLVVVHTVTSANRLDDILSIFDCDPRVQLIYTAIGASAVSDGVDAWLRETGGTTIPWEQAVQTDFALAVAVNHGGDLWKIKSPLVVLSHGIGYSKYSGAGSREPGAGSREPGAGSREPGAGSREPGAGYGLSSAHLLHDGRTFVDALVLSHEEQLTRLANVVPQAVPNAVIAGDPCFDRLRRSFSLRPRYRRALDSCDHTTVVTISSTWGADSLLGRRPTLPAEILSDLPVDTHRVQLVLHPNVWYAHGRRQLRSWLADCIRAGLTLIEPEAGWQQAVLASDVLVGDHGAVTGYAAALGIPVVLGVPRSDDVVDGSAIDAMYRTAPLLDRRRPLRAQAKVCGAEVAELTSAHPGEAAQRVRARCYELLDLDEPADESPVDPYPVRPVPRPVVDAVLVDGVVEADGLVRMRRLPADLRRFASGEAVDGHLAVDADHPLRGLRAQAGVLYRYGPADAPSDSAACVLAAVIEGDTAHLTPGPVRLTSSDVPATAAVSAAYLWLSHGRSLTDLPPEIHIDIGHGPRSVRVGGLGPRMV